MHTHYPFFLFIMVFFSYHLLYNQNKYLVICFNTKIDIPDVQIFISVLRMIKPIILCSRLRLQTSSSCLENININKELMFDKKKNV